MYLVKVIETSTVGEVPVCVARVVKLIIVLDSYLPLSGRGSM